ncbi:FAD binding domain-containing protein [Oharaeibacter diazotrophicus]|uniref:Carbon-monoxide dehydrogenase medium subunit n=1 Tax=Oharaeibacter diazotrophicus TaxID=1920512 RepID=A0A4R6R8Y2_9HYPH|nr:xanthine dehydrogenase family protein subunit M [Oharaeibacter diazotrophicus]TDP82354.1 carbon-monoxide dehydrogenase medium subunit [Oharaeibacter diazotrophicus]BBE72883.1 carbon monoxide dehydrogenase medium chain [Pleomorphomonas sp. SM30]GLS76921.1 carbon monoxide dehydrogenase [Oharaeibacter diazotrophicus]
MYQTTYHRPSTLAEAVALAGTEDAKLLSGGHTLIPTMKQRLAAPAHLVDVARLAELQGIAVSGGTLTIGAATTHATVATSAEVKAAIPALAKLASGIGDPHVRHRGTIGGSVANDDPAADYPSAVLGLGATVVTNKRSIAADDFFLGLFTTALEEGEIVVRFEFPIPEKAAYAKFANPASRYAMAGAFVAKAKDGTVRVAITGAGSDGVFRWTEAEDALAANFSPDAVAGLSVDADAMLSDIHGDGAYRANLVKVMTKRAVAAA